MITFLVNLTHKSARHALIYMLRKFEERCVKNDFYHEEGNNKFHIFIWVWGLVFFVSSAVLQYVLCVYVQRQIDGSKICRRFFLSSNSINIHKSSLQKIGVHFFNLLRATFRLVIKY